MNAKDIMSPIFLLHLVVSTTLFATFFDKLAHAADDIRHTACMATDASAGQHGDVFTLGVTLGPAGPFLWLEG